VGRDARRGQRGRDPGGDLEQVAAVDGGVVARSPGDEQHPAPAGGDVAQAGLQWQEVLDGARDRGRLLGDLGGHAGLGSAHRGP
jgi:hypothetical protein